MDVCVKEGSVSVRGGGTGGADLEGGREESET